MWLRPAHRRIGKLCQTEVQYFHGFVTAKFDIGGLEVPVDDPLLVRRFKSFGYLARNRQRLCSWQRAARDPIGECRSVDQFQDKRLEPVRLLEPVYRRNVWMIQ